MKRTLKYLSICLALLAFNSHVFAQSSGKYYSFSTQKKVGKIKIKYDADKDVIEIVAGRSSNRIARDKTEWHKTFKGKMYYKGGSNSGRIFLQDDGSLLMTEDISTSSFGDCKVKYNESKHKAIIYLSLDKAKTSAMNKEKAIELFEDAFSRVCQAYRVYNEAKIAKVELPEEGMKDAKLLPTAIKVAKNWITKKRWKETMVGGYFFSKEWNTIRHKRSGNILGRRARLIGLLKMPDGRCKFGHFMIRQNYNGSKYGVTFCEANSRVFEVSCAKVEAKTGK